MQFAARESIRSRYLQLDTSAVADVLDEMGFGDQGLHSHFGPVPVEGGKLAGFAYTIRGQMTPYDGGGDRDKMAACEGVSPNEVSVWSGDGEGICYFGELIAVGMKERGCCGALVDGGVRDVRWLRMHGFPVFARYRTPIQSIGRWKVNGCQIPVSATGATRRFVNINPGDFILADEDGALVIPAGIVVEVLERVERLARQEDEIRRDLSGGMSLAAALAKYGHV